LWQKLAYEDAAVQELADYFRLTNLLGEGQGIQRLWPLSVYSDAVDVKILAEKLINDFGWDQWRGIGY